MKNLPYLLATMLIAPLAFAETHSNPLMEWELRLDSSVGEERPGDNPSEVGALNIAQAANGQSDETQNANRQTQSAGSYVDQIIGGEESEEGSQTGTRQPDDSEDTHGRRLLSIEYNLFHEDSLRTETEHGVVLRLSQETTQHGIFSLDARAKYDAVGGDENNRLGEYLTLRQDEFALSEDWLMDNVLGDLIARPSPLVGHSYRRTLGGSLLRGASTRLYSDESEFSLSIGKTGDLDGTGTRTFTTDPGTLAGLGFTRNFGDYWSAGMQAWVLRDDELVEEHESIAAAVQYTDPQTRTRGQLHTLVDSNANLGVWADGDHYLGRWRHRFGVFRLEPELAWSDVRIDNDTQGFYWRGDLRGFRRTWGMGLDVQESNIESIATRFGRVSGKGFVNLTWRLNRRASAGGIATVNLQRPGTGLGAQSIDGYGLTTFLSNEFDIGRSRFRGSYDVADGDTIDDQTYLLSWDHDWTMPRRKFLGI